MLVPSTAWAGSILLRSGAIDTSSVPRAAAAARPSHGAGYYLISLKGPVRATDKDALEAAGARLIKYVPEYAFLAKVDHCAVAEIARLDQVEWIGPFRPEYKRAAQTGVRVDAEGRAEQYLVNVLPGVSVDYVASKVKAAGARLISTADGVCRVLAKPFQLTRIAQIADVEWIEPYVQPKLCNSQSELICGVPRVRQDLGLYGAGQIIGLADAGLDTGNMSTLSPDFSGRVLKAYSLRRANDWSDLNGHGSHVAGSAVGAGVLSGSNPSAHSYEGSLAGYAPEAKLVFQSIGDGGDMVFPPLYLSELFQPAYDDGVRVHSNSWGSAAKGRYTTYSNHVDQFVWDHKDFTAVFAVGNDAEDLNQDGVADSDNIYSPATAKNCISVGASENLRTTGGYQMGYGVAWPSSYPVTPLKYDLMSNNSNGVAAFSGRGPTDDGRIKPDICAPGTNIVSCRTHNCWPVGWAVYDSDYLYWGGTSMSTPQVAGAAALVRNYYKIEKSTEASAALVKATLIHGAADMSPGQYGTDRYREIYPAPDNSQGWGRLNLKNSLRPDLPVVNEFADESPLISTGDTREYQYTVIDNSVPLKATLVWTDYPGAVLAAKELVNDLDLTVVSPSGTSYPLYGPTERTNNVEQLTIAQPEMGVYRVRVTGHNVPMGPQDYSLVVSGGLPNTYIAGTATSDSGAGVQGALVTVMSSEQVKRITTSASGRYMTHVGPGSYSVQIAKPGWSFTPRGRVVTVDSAPVEGIDFQGRGAPGSVSGRINAELGGVISQIVESPHPYLNNFDRTWTITAHEGANRIRVHFAEIDLMDEGDVVTVLDGADNTIDTFTGRGEDIWSSWVDGNVIKINLTADGFGNIGYGFYVDGYETDLLNQGGVEGMTVELSPGGYQTTTAQDGTYGIASVPPGVYAVTPSKPHWKLQPATATIDVPAGGSVSNTDFTAFPPGSIAGEVIIAESQVANVNIESDHPYPDNYDNTWSVDAGPGVSRIRLHFDLIDTEPAWDFVYIIDGSDNVVEAYTARSEDLWTPWMNGRVVQIMLSTDSGGDPYYGFRCDKYEAQTIAGGLEGVRCDLSPDGAWCLSDAQGLFGFGEVDVGNHVLKPSLALWTFDPPEPTVSVSPGTGAHPFLYAQLSDLQDPSQARRVGDGVRVTLRDVVISARFGGFFYVTKPGLVGGIRVVWGAPVTEGAVVDIVGRMSTVDGERRIVAYGVTPS
jgi:subtilisin family serine protease